MERGARYDRAPGGFVDNYGHGLWFDGDNQRVVIDSVFSARNKMRGLFVELNLGPITVKDSKLCENGFEGVANARSNNLTLSYNQIFDNKYWQIIATGSATPLHDQELADRPVLPGGLAKTGRSRTTSFAANRSPEGTRPPTSATRARAGGSSGRLMTTSIPTVASTLTSDYNQWYHSGTTKSFRVPSAQGSAVDFATFRTLMSKVKSNDAHSTWSNSTALSCTP